MIASEISVQVSQTTLLDEVSISVPEASVTVVMGRNGSGKTTLLRALAGLQSIDSGSVVLKGRPVSAIPIRNRPSVIGFVPQHPASLLLGQSVRDEIEISTARTGQRECEEAILRRFRLEHLANHYSYDISGGEQQRLAIAIATAAKPAVLILDEPTRGMDQQARDELLELLSELRQSGTAILLSTHDSNLAARIAERVILMDRGSVTCVGSPAGVFSNESFLMTDIGRTLGPDFLTVESVASAINGASGPRPETQFQPAVERSDAGD